MTQRQLLASILALAFVFQGTVWLAAADDAPNEQVRIDGSTGNVARHVETIAREQESGQPEDMIVMAVRKKHVVDLGWCHLQGLHADGGIEPDVHEDAVVDDETHFPLV